MIDGYPVVPGDSVWVQGTGAGMVARVDDKGGFWVKLSGGETYFRSGGYAGTTRRVYWHDPILVNPPKNLKLWAAYRTMTQELFKQLDTLIKEGQVPDVAKNS